MANASQSMEQRISSRENFHCEIQYILEDSIQYCPGILENLSQTGAFVSLNDKLELNSDLTVTVEPEYPDQLAMHIDVKIVRILDEAPSDKQLYGYGCEIISHSDMFP